ncbi:ROK family protein [Alicyclobacillus sp. SO9]|uniref:ROK family protein n=1 Tax=Alicyclobacillus sp. SO9 TaxID=2665646 RepID=UPI0018E7FFA2|nr:ROK family protein [Alicyclobacillus sp. SO9]QQE79244.1 ROK family protein [Alicyclobacillus sp. SO9]
MSYVIGLDVGGTTIKGGIFTTTAQPLAEIRFRTYDKNNVRDEILASMSSVIHRLEEQADRLGLGRMEGVGIGVPGFVSSSEGVVYKAANLALINVKLRQWFEERFNVPCVVQGDARTGALGEFEFGAGKGAESLLYVVIGTGVGSGMILNGEIYEGVHALAGEIGHTIIHPDGQLCACGKRGCLETLVSGPAIVREYRNRTESQSETVPEIITKRAEAGEQAALDVYKNVAKTLGIALANYCTIVDPSRIVIGGGVSLAGSVLFNPLREFFRAYASPGAAKSIDIRPASLGDRSGLVGASLLVKKSWQMAGRH